jgi:hypothetical protein
VSHSPQLRAREREGRAVCAYCHDLLGAEPTRCGGCGAEYHADCRRELGRCATVGCAASAAPPRVAREPRIEGVGRGVVLALTLLAAGAASVLAVTEAVTALATGTRSDGLPSGPWPALCAGSLFLPIVALGLGVIVREGWQALRRRAERRREKAGS